MRAKPSVTDQIDSPISTTYALLSRRTSTRPLLDLSQAAPGYPPAPEVADRVAAVAHEADGGRYVGTNGLPALREAFAAELSTAYRGRVEPADVLVTAGCNQAFCLTVSALAGPGDQVIMPLPFYFNHDMWLRMHDIEPVYLEPGPDLVPTVDAAAALVTDRTRAIVLVTPGNPSGVTLPPDTIAAFADLAARHDVPLLVDETYRTFRGTDEPAHPLFADPAWRDTVVSLHSFAKDLAIPGYRVGALVAAPSFVRQVAKLLDCVAICAPRIGQEAALAGLAHAGEWRRARAAEVAARLAAFRAAMADRPGGFELVTCGAYFGWVRHPFPDRSTGDVVRDLLLRHDALTIPGTAFLPDDRRMLRVSVGNATPAESTEFAARLGGR